MLFLVAIGFPVLGVLSFCSATAAYEKGTVEVKASITDVSDRSSRALTHRGVQVQRECFTPTYRYSWAARHGIKKATKEPKMIVTLFCISAALILAGSFSAVFFVKNTQKERLSNIGLAVLLVGLWVCLLALMRLTENIRPHFFYLEFDVTLFANRFVTINGGVMAIFLFLKTLLCQGREARYNMGAAAALFYGLDVAHLMILPFLSLFWALSVFFVGIAGVFLGQRAWRWFMGQYAPDGAIAERTDT